MAFYNLQTNIIEQADAFYEAYKRCLEGKNSHKDEFGRHCESIVAIPAIVNGAFACELYMKYLLGNCKTGHNLKELFYKLDTNQQSFVIKIVNEQFKSHPVYNFDVCIEDASNAFIEWRYIFEKEHTDGFMGCRINELPMFFDKFLYALQLLVKGKNKL